MFFFVVRLLVEVFGLDIVLQIEGIVSRVTDSRQPASTVTQPTNVSVSLDSN